MLGIIWREKSGEEDKNALGTGKGAGLGHPQGHPEKQRREDPGNEVKLAESDPIDLRITDKQIISCKHT